MSYRLHVPLLLVILMATGIAAAGSAADQPAAEFGVQGSFTQGFAPFTAQFEDHSALAASWSWNFGDGTTSTERNPAHTYTDPGTYTVSLTVTDATGTLSNTKTIPGCIIVAADPMSVGTVTTETTVVPAYSDTVTPATTMPATTATPALSGMIAVTSRPTGAMVSLDGVQQGISPITLYGIPAGLHKVLVHLKGYTDKTMAVTVEHEKTVTLDLDLVEEDARPASSPAYTRTTGPTVIETTGTDVMKAAAAPSSGTPAGQGSIHIYCTGCSNLKSDGKPVTYIDYEIWTFNKTTGHEDTTWAYGQMATLEEQKIEYVPAGDYSVRVKPQNFRAEWQQTTVRPLTESPVRFNDPRFVKTPGFEVAAALLAIAGLAGLRRFR